MSAGNVVPVTQHWDLAIVGAGPAGSTAALAALHARPELRVLLLDRADFPRDKTCGDGITPHVFDVLAELGVTGLFDDWEPVRRLNLSLGTAQVQRDLRRPTWVIPRQVFDARLVTAATDAGATLQRRRVKSVERVDEGVLIDGELFAPVVIGADGAHSMVRTAAGLPPARRRALALRGYVPTPADRAGLQVIAYGPGRQPSYAWSFDRGDGYSNVGYGELLASRRPTPSRTVLMQRLEELLPGATGEGDHWKGHHLPLSSWRWPHPDGRILLAGDAASLINPMTGEGIYDAVVSGMLAGRTAAVTPSAAAGARYRAAVRARLGSHQRHTAAVARLSSSPALVTLGIHAAARNQQVFDDLVEVGLASGRVTRRAVRSLVSAGLNAAGDLVRQ